MCTIPGDKMAEAMRDEMQRMDVMAKTLNQINAVFRPALQRAREQADKIQRAAELCREADEDAQP